MKIRQSLEQIHSHPAWPAAEKIFRRLNGMGHLTVFAGGCVRDSLLGVEPKDLDLATSARPEEIESCFERTLAVGKAFGTIVVVEDGHAFEVTTFRKDGPYLDARRPAHVHFSDIREDAQRRDFTVNALFYDPLKVEILDYVGGVEDLRRRVLRTVGDPFTRFAEDRLRLLRAVRFVSQLGFEVDPATLKAIRDMHDQLRGVSAERILNEVKRFLTGVHLRDGLRVLRESRLADDFLARDFFFGTRTAVRLPLIPQLGKRFYRLHAFVWSHGLHFASACVEVLPRDSSCRSGANRRHPYFAGSACPEDGLVAGSWDGCVRGYLGFILRVIDVKGWINRAHGASGGRIPHYCDTRRGFARASIEWQGSFARRYCSGRGYGADTQSPL
ncbi:MAG: CCA tRNA nucleotidyltransferase [Calothrix sp. SM1_5_4]|nr:CCA tRNA nucleotidyltransferase [Calothrix sp. SM1_5_4]